MDYDTMFEQVICLAANHINDALKYPDDKEKQENAMNWTYLVLEFLAFDKDRRMNNGN